jgi:flagellar hook assembly protein FlgD
MADFMADLNGIYGNKQVANQNIKIEKKGDNTKLDMTDFIQLMITQLTNQGIDESVDTSDMLNQMIQMQMVETMATLTDASVMSYAASLVGEKVTVGKFDSDNKLQEVYGTVTGTGTMNGNQVIFLDNNEYYLISEILAVGKLPPPKEEDGDDKVDGTEKPGETPKPDGTDKPEGTPKPDETEKPGETPKPDEVQKPEGTSPEYGGENGTPDNQGA